MVLLHLGLKTTMNIPPMAPPQESESSSEWTQTFISARNGSGKDLHLVFEACRDYLLMIAQAEIGSTLLTKADASDVVHESLIEIRNDLEQFRGSTWEDFLRWSVHILRNNILDQARKYRQTQQRNVSREEMLAPQNQCDHSAHDPAQQAETMDLVEQLRKLIVELSPKKRRVLELKLQTHFSWSEIGQQLEIEPDSARKLWFRTVEELRMRLKPQQD